MIFSVYALSLREPPEPLNQVQVRRVAGQKQQSDTEVRSQALYHLVPLILGIVEYHRDRTDQLLGGDFPEQFTHGLGVDYGRVGDGNQASCDGVPGPEYVEPLATRSRPNENPRDAPQVTQEGAVDEVGGIDEEEVTDPGDGIVEGRLKLGFQEFLLDGDVLGQRLLGGTGTARVRCQVKPKPARKVRV